jgi:hypothetical protein
MKFELETVGDFYSEENKTPLEQLGFKFENVGKPYYFQKLKTEQTIELNSLEELMDFINKYGKVIIEEDNCIYLYDDYCE